LERRANEVDAPRVHLSANRIREFVHVEAAVFVLIEQRHRLLELVFRDGDALEVRSG
jgi:hypothetical protein